MGKWRAAFASERDMLAYALWTIYNNTETKAIRHRDYDHLAGNIAECAKSALEAAGLDPAKWDIHPQSEGPEN